MFRLFLLALAAALLLTAAACAESADFAALYPDRFLPEGSEPQWTESSYASENIAVEISTQRYQESDVYVADIYVRSVECIRRSFSGGKWDSTAQSVKAHAEENHAIAALTGDNGHLISVGWVIGNGTVLRDSSNNKRDLCVLYRDGTMVTYQSRVDNELIRQHVEEGRIWQSFLFGPALLTQDGKAIEDFSSVDVRYANPRAVIGYYAPGHYCLVQVDGRETESALEERDKNDGITLAELSALMESLGCKAAYNLDGGQSAVMCFHEEVISTPFRGGRKIADAVVLVEPEE